MTFTAILFDAYKHLLKVKMEPDPRDEVVTSNSGHEVHISIDNDANLVDIKGVEIDIQHSESSEVIEAIESIESVAENYESQGYDVTGLSDWYH